MNELIFGTAGIPLSSFNHSTVGGIERVRELGLGAMELEFVRSINVSEESAVDVRKAASNNDVILTCHAPYFINLNAVEREKIEASVHRIVRSAAVAWLCGGYSTTFHAGFYLNQAPQKVYDKIRDGIVHIRKLLDDQGIDIWLRPETTGKMTQFAGLKELLQISEEIEGVMPCIDFAHMHARTGGKNNTELEFRSMLESVEKSLGKEGLKNMHIHMSGIHYTDKGERHHLPLDESDFNYKDLLKVWKEFKIAGVVISESPLIEQDALLMQKYYMNL